MWRARPTPGHRLGRGPDDPAIEGDSTGVGVSARASSPRASPCVDPRGVVRGRRKRRRLLRALTNLARCEPPSRAITARPEPVSWLPHAGGAPALRPREKAVDFSTPRAATSLEWMERLHSSDLDKNGISWCGSPREGTCSMDPPLIRNTDFGAHAPSRSLRPPTGEPRSDEEPRDPLRKPFRRR